MHSGDMHVEAVERAAGLRAVLAAVQQAVGEVEILHMLPHISAVPSYKDTAPYFHTSKTLTVDTHLPVHLELELARF